MRESLAQAQAQAGDFARVTTPEQILLRLLVRHPELVQEMEAA